MELGGFERPTSWVRSRLADSPESTALQVFQAIPQPVNSAGLPWITADYAQLSRSPALSGSNPQPQLPALIILSDRIASLPL